MNKFLLIDGSSLLFRAHFAMGRLTAPDGRESGALYGLASSLRKAVKDYKPDFVGVIFDRPEPTFRHVEYPDYKGNRPEMPEGLAAQMPYIEPMVAMLGLKYLALPGFEADDLIGTLARQAEEAGVECEILTADKDLLQLVTQKTKVIHTKWENLLLGPAEVLEKFGVRPDQVIDTLALMGDASDNIPGVTGIGEKTAKALITKYDSLDGVYAHLDELKGKQKENLEKERDLALLSRRLASVERFAPVEFSAVDYTPQPPDRAACVKFFTEWNFRTLRDEFAGGSGALAAENAAEEIPASAVADAGPPLETREVSLDSLGLFLRTQTSGVRMNREEDQLRLTAAYETGAVSALASERDFIPALADAKAFVVADLKTTAHRFPLLAEYLFTGGEDPLLMDALLRPDEPNWSIPVLAQSLHLPYAAAPAEEARLLLRASIALREKLAARQLEKLHDELERPLLRVLYEMEAAGVAVDLPVLRGLSEKFAIRLAEIETRAHELAGMAFNLASPKQVGEALFEKMGLPVVKRTGKTKTYSTDAEVLEQLAGEHEIARVLLEHRELSKLKGTYLDALPEYIAADGRIHTTFDPAGAATGRLSSRDPNMQNIPARGEWGHAIRTAFITAPGRILLGADYSQIELRLMAHLAQDEAMIAAFAAGRDIHTETAAGVFGVMAGAVTNEMRSAAKTVNFGIIYGQGAFTLARQIGVPPREASQFIEAYFAKFPGVKRYIDATRALALDAGEVTTILGRKRFFKGLAQLPHMRREAGLRAAVNATIQGSAADLMKVAMITLNTRLHAEKLDWKLLLQVHDELLLEGDPRTAQQAAEALRESMESASKLAVPLTAEVRQGKNWAQTKG